MAIEHKGERFFPPESIDGTLPYLDKLDRFNRRLELLNRAVQLLLRFNKGDAVYQESIRWENEWRKLESEEGR